MVFLVVVKFFVFVSEVVSIFSKILTWIFWGAKGYLCPTNSIIGGARPGCSPKSTPMYAHTDFNKLEGTLLKANNRLFSSHKTYPYSSSSSTSLVASTLNNKSE